MGPGLSSNWRQEVPFFYPRVLPASRPRPTGNALLADRHAGCTWPCRHCEFLLQDDFSGCLRQPPSRMCFVGGKWGEGQSTQSRHRSMARGWPRQAPGRPCP
jgi:hypothetical protein